MPNFFFHLASPAGLERDDLGLAFEGVEAAYLDGCRAALEISMDMLRRRQDPSLYSFEIHDDLGRLVIEIPFHEVLQPRRPAVSLTKTNPVHERLQATLLRSRALKADIAAELIRARQSLENARATLKGGRQAGAAGTS